MRTALACFAFVVLLAGIFWLTIRENIHTLVPGQVYRSAELGAEDWSETIQHYHLKAILNLRGANPDKLWYQDEIRTADHLGVTHADLALSANRQLTPAELEQLLQLLKTLPHPLLIHCKQGADRTGLAAAIYVYAILHQPPAMAHRQLSLRYGHFPWLGSHTVAMDRSFNAFVASHPQAN